MKASIVSLAAHEQHRGPSRAGGAAELDVARHGLWRPRAVLRLQLRRGVRDPVRAPANAKRAARVRPTSSQTVNSDGSCRTRSIGLRARDDSRAAAIVRSVEEEVDDLDEHRTLRVVVTNPQLVVLRQRLDPQPKSSVVRDPGLKAGRGGEAGRTLCHPVYPPWVSGGTVRAWALMI